MNVASGVLTTPVPVTYHFEFFGMKDQPSTHLYVELRVNGASVGIDHTYQTGKGSIDTVSLSASLRLKPNDKVNLYKSGSGMLLDGKYTNQFTHFTGWLVEEKLLM